MKHQPTSNLSFILGISSLLIPAALIFVFRHQFQDIERFIPTSGIWGPIFSITLMGILSATPIPTDPIVMLNGAIFGPFVGFIVSWLGNNFAAIIEYFIGLGIRQLTDFDVLRKKLPFGLSKFSPDSYPFLLFGRFIPQFGGKLVSLAGGVYRVSFLKYLWTTLVANLFGSLLLAYGGHTLLHSLL